MAPAERLAPSAPPPCTMAGSALAEESATSPDITWDMEADLVVVGSGGGVAGAITAAEAGLEVIVLEKLDILGGSSAMHSGVVACGGGTSLQQEAGIEETPEQYFDYLMACAKGQANEALVEAIANEVPELRVAAPAWAFPSPPWLSHRSGREPCPRP